MTPHTPPIVPHVLYVGEQRTPWQLAPIERLATRYHTPTTVALEFGTLDATVRPSAGKAGTTKQQHQVWCLPDDAAWGRITQTRAAFQQALDALAGELRQLGTYASQLESAGGFKSAPNPLCATVIEVPDPDASELSYWFSAPPPPIERKEISGHTPKMLNVVKHGKAWSQPHQRNHFVCPSDADWQRVRARYHAANAANDAWQQLLAELGTYQDALADGRYPALVSATPTAITVVDAAVVGVAMMGRDEAQALVTRIKRNLDGMRADLLDLYEREGWRALGYDSWRACAGAEFGASAATLYRHLEAAEIERDVRGGDFSQVEKTIPTVQLQAVKALSSAERRQAFDRADQLAGERPRTAADVRQAAAEIAPPAGPSIADGQHIKQIRQILRTLDQWDAREHPRRLQDAYAHARQINDQESYDALMAEVDRAAQQHREPPLPPAPPAARADWWHVGTHTRALQSAIDRANRHDAIAAAQQLLAALLDTERPVRPRRPASADVSALLRYLAEIEQYALLLDLRMGAAQSLAPPAVPPVPAPDALLLGDIPDGSPLAPIQQGVLEVSAWLGISGPHADDEEIAVNRAELAALRHALDVEADNPRVELAQWELLSAAIGELDVALRALRQAEAVAA